MDTPRNHRVAALLAASFSLMTAACQPPQDRRAGRIPADIVVAQADSIPVRGANGDAAPGVSSRVEPNRGPAVAGADVAPDKVADAVITSSVRAELAHDSQLNTGTIAIDTTGGNVALRGSVPDADARERATRLAARVQGVSTIDNRTAIEPEVP